MMSLFREHGASSSQLRKAQKIGDGLYAEINLSANGLRDVIRMMLDTFEISWDRLRLFLREGPRRLE